MKLLRIKMLPEAVVMGCLAVCSTLPVLASGKIEEGVDTLVNFTGKNGAQPQAIIEDSAGNFYGTTLNGGTYGKGTVFEILQNGKLITMINFSGKDGASPEAGLLLGPDGSLYGTTKAGGADNKGTVFKITPDAKFLTLISFSGENGSQPDSGLQFGKDGNVYGATLYGGAHNKGIVFRITPSGKLTVVVTFDGTNGANPGSLVQGADGALYGTANQGGSGKGLIFKIGADGKIIVLVTFTGPNGAFPVSGLILSEDGNFYGTTADGGAHDLGIVYMMTPDGKLTIITSFNGANGAHPDSGLVEWSNGYFYMTQLWKNMLVKSANVQWSGDNYVGTTSSGGAHGNGTVFRVGDNGNLVTIVSFTGSEGTDLGARPNSLVAGLDGNLYGTTGFGGTSSEGTVYRLVLQLWFPPTAGNSTGASAGSYGFSPPIVSQ